MKKYIKYFLTITKHKYYVGVECLRRGLYFQAILHDMSKFSLSEFIISSRYWGGNSRQREESESEYKFAWLHHIHQNKHHWEHWVITEDGKPKALKMPQKYVLEMLCDWIGAGKAYKNEEWTPREPLDFYRNGEGEKMVLHQDTRRHFEFLLKELAGE